MHRGLLARCREVGIAQAFGEQGGAEDEIAIPPGFEADIVEVQQLLAQVEQGPHVQVALIRVWERMLARLRPGSYASLRAGILRSLAGAYGTVAISDLQANLARSISYFQQAFLDT